MKVYKWLIILVMVILVGWQYDAFQKNLHEVEIRIKKFESVDLFNILEQISLAHIESIESVDILNKKQMEVQALEKKIIDSMIESEEKFAIQEIELRTQLKTIETKLQKLRSEVNDALTKIERNVSTIDSVVDEKFKTLWMMINNK